MKTSTLIAVVASLLRTLSFAQAPANNRFTLRVQTGQVDRPARIFLAYQFEGKKILDSAVAKDGWYVLSGVIEQPLQATLIADNDSMGSQQLLTRSRKGQSVTSLQFFLHPGSIRLQTDKDLSHPVFKGSVINTDNERLKKMLLPISDQQVAISRQLRTSNAIVSAKEMPADRQPVSTYDSLQIRRWVKQLDSLAGATRPIIKQFIQANPDSYISLQQLRSYGGSFPDLSLIEPMYQRLSASVRNTVAGKEYAKIIFDRKNLVTGTKAPEFKQNDVNGNPVSLSSFKGKYVLLDFWASWCGPCRKESTQLVEIFQDFKNKNFTILGISLDEADSKTAWLQAIKDDNLQWTQVSDLKHWDNSVAKLYSINAIPQSFLIGPDGTIIAKSLTTVQLRKKLEEILTP